MLTTTTSGFWTTKSSGFTNLQFPCPSSIEAFDREAGSVGQALHYAVENIGLRSTLPEFNRKLALLVEAAFSVKRAIDDKATAKERSASKTPNSVSPVYESTDKFLRRLRPTLSPEQLIQLDKIARDLALTIRVDPSPMERRGAVAAEHLRSAESLLSADPSVYEDKITKFTEYVGGFILDRVEAKPTVESLGRLIQLFYKRKQEEADEELALQD